MFKTMTIAAALLVMFYTSRVTAQSPEEFKNNFSLHKIGGQEPATALATWSTVPYPKHVSIVRIKVSPTFYALEGAMKMSDSTSINFIGNLHKGPKGPGGTTWWHGVMSSSPNTDAQKALPYSVTLVFYTQNFRTFNAHVSVVDVAGAATFGQTGTNVWSFGK